MGLLLWAGNYAQARGIVKSRANNGNADARRAHL